MERIYTNLLSNAFKFTPEKGTIKVQLSGNLLMKKFMKDTEVINSREIYPYENKIKRNFRPFYQAGSKTGGSGIGLALVKGYVNLHGGKINVSKSNGFVLLYFFYPR
ncbi:MAG: ATP-binding protein [Bacteroidales bacterium]